ncbi:NAD(P)H-dependent oxidoreductase, partial [Streptomyces sp. NPDC059082]|uniref:NAD(P)H-dependent oxidoreductase n=1 Tax=Streptomyces sp. NPDC059082 TaxID=3346720 RepID=UPI0036CEE24A
MATLLHIDTSFNGDDSHSRAVTAAYRKAWEAEHPEGTVIYRDLVADPVPHLEAAAYYAGATAPGGRGPGLGGGVVLGGRVWVVAERA